TASTAARCRRCVRAGLRILRQARSTRLVRAARVHERSPPVRVRARDRSLHPQLQVRASDRARRRRGGSPEVAAMSRSAWCRWPSSWLLPCSLTVSQDDTTLAADLHDASRLPIGRTFAALGRAEADLRDRPAATTAIGHFPRCPTLDPRIVDLTTKDVHSDPLPCEGVKVTSCSPSSGWRNLR